MSYKVKRIIKDIVGWDEEGQLSRKAWLSYGKPCSSRQTEHNNGLMVSLTTIPSRIYRVHVTIESILRQTTVPIRVALWLTESQFPDLDKLPKPLLNQKKRGLEIYHCNTDWPHQKLLPSLAKWPKTTIVTADDDLIYPVDWLCDLTRVHKLFPGIIVCRRARLMLLEESGELAKYDLWPLNSEQFVFPSHAIFPTGVSGTLYPPGVLHEDVFNEELANKSCPRADDIWFKVMAFRQGTKCVATSVRNSELPVLQGSQGIALNNSNVAGGKNDVQFCKTLSLFDIDAKLFFNPDC